MQDRRRFLYTSATGAAALGLGRWSDAHAAGPPRGDRTARPATERRAADGSATSAPRAMNLLILGGTSFIGPHQIAYALDRGHSVSIFTRGQTEPTTHPGLLDHVEQLVGDRSDDLTALEGREWDAVIDNSASVPRWVRDSAGLLQDHVGRYLFVSSISAYRDYAEVGITEEYPTAVLEDPTVEEVTGATYGGMKALSEQMARDAFGDRAIIVRPGLIVGPGDRTDRWTYWPVRIERGGEVMAPGTPADPSQVIDARDLAEFMVRLVEDEASGTFQATGPEEPYRMDEMLYGIRAATTGPVDFTWVDAAFLAEHEVAPWGQMTAWIPPDGDSRGILQVDVSKALAAGLTFRPLATTAMDTLEWWAGLPDERRASPRAGLPAEREAEVLAAWHSR